MSDKLAIRSMFVSRPEHVLVQVDLSQAESWVTAYLANEQNMKWSLLNSDIHTDTAGSALFFNNVGCSHLWDKESLTCNKCNNVVTKVMRFLGKKNNHANAYGMGPERNAEVINQESDQPPYVVVTVAETRKYQADWHNYYPGIKQWWLSTQEDLNVNKRVLSTPYGRERKFYGRWGNELFKEAYAFRPQSTIADHFNGAIQPELGIKGGLLEVSRQIIRKHPSDIILRNQSHDSCILDVHKTIYKEIAEHVKSLIKRPLIINDNEVTIPVDCEVGERWGELEKLNASAPGKA